MLNGKPVCGHSMQSASGSTIADPDPRTYSITYGALDESVDPPTLRELPPIDHYVMKDYVGSHVALIGYSDYTFLGIRRAHNKSKKQLYPFVYLEVPSRTEEGKYDTLKINTAMHRGNVETRFTYAQDEAAVFETAGDKRSVRFDSNHVRELTVKDYVLKELTDPADLTWQHYTGHFNTAPKEFLRELSI